jgi:hypothetical protein
MVGLGLWSVQGVTKDPQQSYDFVKGTEPIEFGIGTTDEY